MGAAVMSLDVVDLARQETEGFAAQIVGPIMRALHSSALKLLTPIISPIVLAKLSHVTHSCQRLTVVLRGARAGIEDTPCAEKHLDASDTLRTELDTLGADLLKQAPLFRSFGATLKHRELAVAFAKLADACDELYDETRQFGSAIQAHDANVDALGRATRGRAHADFDSLAQELQHAIG